MGWFKILFFQVILISISFCEVSENVSRFTSVFVEYLNNIPDHPYIYSEPELTRTKELHEKEVYVEIKVKATDLHNVYSYKYLNCSVIINDLGEKASVHDSQCTDYVESVTENVEELVTDLTTVDITDNATDSTTIDGPIQLENEVQPSDTAYTSGEQFIAIPRVRPAPCIGCSSIVDTNAPGVTELANLGVRQLDRHEPNTRHSLNNVLLVERQVQVVGGIRYIITLNIDYDNCTLHDTNDCKFQKTCKVSILEKPWHKLEDGSKVRLISSNNCTEYWLFDISSTPGENSSIRNDIIPNMNNSDTPLPIPNSDETVSSDEIKEVHAADIQAQPNTAKSLSDQQLKELQEQIVPYSKLNQPKPQNVDTNSYTASTTETDTENRVSDLKASKTSTKSESTQPFEEEKKKISGLPVDKIKALDELMTFFDFAGVKVTDTENDNIRIKRDYGKDLEVLNVAENFRNMQNKIKNALYIHKLAQVMVDYINELDIEVKNRFLKNVIGAEAEFDNGHQYFYIQARIAVPCDKTYCKTKDKEVKTCTGIIDVSTDNPSAMNVLCYDEQTQEKEKFKPVQNDDIILVKLIYGAIKEMEFKSDIPHALRIKKILRAITQQSSVTLLKVTAEIEYLDCNKSTSLYRRHNCSTLEYLGTQVCDFEIFMNRGWNEKKVSYVCTDRPVGESFISNIRKNVTFNSSDLIRSNEVLEIVQEALQYLELKSNRNNKQKLVEIKSASKQTVAGLLTTVIFVVGYTSCQSDFKKDLSLCHLLRNEPFRNCSVEVWDRPWLDDGRQVKVACEDMFESNIVKNITKVRNKRSSDLYSVVDQKEEDIDDLRYKTLVDDSLQKFVQTTGSNQHYQLVKIVKVTVQAISGKETLIDFRISPTNCQVDASGRPKSSNCIVREDAEVIDCHSRIWEKSSLKNKEIEVDCNVRNKENIKKRSIDPQAPGKVEENANQLMYIKLVDNALKSYLTAFPTDKYMHYKLAHIEKVKKRDKAGECIEIEFLAVPTNCTTYGELPTSLSCVENTLSCHLEILKKLSDDNKIINIDCQINQKKFRKRRQLGGEIEQSVTDPKYRKLAEESMTKYVLMSGITQYHKVTKIYKVYTQIVNGILTKIHFKAVPTECQVDSKGQPTSSDCRIQISSILRCHTDVWQKSSQSKNDITVKCSPVKLRSKREIMKAPLIGGLSFKNPQNPDYQKLAEDSLTQYVTTSGINQYHKLVKIESVTTQVVSGLMTKIAFKASATDCLMDSNGLPTSSFCKIKDTTKVLNCFAKIWEQPWLSKKETNVTCKPVFSRSKRHVGGVKIENPKDPKFLKLTEQSLAKYVTSFGISKYYKTIEVSKATTQIVSGLLTKIEFKACATNCLVDSNGQPTAPTCEIQNLQNVIVCHADIWEQSWLKKKEITVDCSPVESRSKRQLPGGEKTQDPSDPKYLKLAEQSLAKYVTNDSGISKYYKVIEVSKVTTQVVSGLLTKIEFKACATNCLVDSNGQPTSPTCEIQNLQNVIVCHADIWEQSWLKKKEITVDCSPVESRSKRQLPGGEKTQDPRDPKYLKLAEQSLAKYVTDDSGINKYHKIIEVSKVTTQVVSGLLTKIEFKACATNCLVDSNGQPTSPNCEIQNLQNVIICHAKIWEQSWLKKKEITVDCSPVESRSKRQSPGGEEKQDRNNSVLLKLADESLAKYVASTGISRYYKTIEIIKVATQIVYGKLTKIDFKASATNCLVDNNGQPFASFCEIQDLQNILSCHTDVWEKPWQKEKEITISCSPTHLTPKRPVLNLGGDLTQDPKDAKFIGLANEALTKYTMMSGYSQLEHKILEIEKVTTQVAFGTLTKLDFSITSFRCPLKNLTKSKDHNCEILYCHAEIWEKPWLKENNKDIDVVCSDFKYLKASLSYSVENFNNSTPNETVLYSDVRNKRASTRIRSGGDQEQEPDKLEYKKFALEALRKYVSSNKLESSHKILKVNRVVTQVVSGIIYKIDFTAVQTKCKANINKIDLCEPIENGTLDCHTEIWDIPWSKIRKIDVFCEHDDGSESNEELNSERRKKRNVINSLNVNEINDRLNSTDHYFKVKDDKLKTNYSTVLSTQNVKYPNHSSKDDIVKKRSKYNTPYYLQLAKSALRKFEKMANAERLHKVIKVHYVSEQDDGGARINIDFAAAPTTCIRDKSNNSVCEILNSKINCRAAIDIFMALDQSLIKIIDVDCTDPNKNRHLRQKRSVDPGDNYVEDDLKYYYAEKLLSKYNSKTYDSPNLFKLITIYDSRRSFPMNTPMISMYISIAKTYCMRGGDETEVSTCNEIEGLYHKTCLGRLWPSTYDDLVLANSHIICDDELDFSTVSGFNPLNVVLSSVQRVNEQNLFQRFVRPLEEIHIVPTLDYDEPLNVWFLVAITDCTVEDSTLLPDLTAPNSYCRTDSTQGVRTCHSRIYLTPHSRKIKHINVTCAQRYRTKRSVSIDSGNFTDQDLNIQKLVQESLQKLEMESIHKYKQRVLTINSYTTKIANGQETTIDFYVGYTNCLKFEWVDNITSCQFLEHLPRRHCVSKVKERVFIHNGRHIDVQCGDDETPLEASMELEGADNALALANEGLKRIEYKYPHPRRQKVVRIFTFEKQTSAGLHYRMKLEVGYTDCMALSEDDNCNFDPRVGNNKFCRVNVWVRPWTSHPPSYRVSCDYHDAMSDDIYHQMQAEQLFNHFLTTYHPAYLNNYGQLRERFQIFKENVKKIHELNVYEQGTARYAINRFADLSVDEFKEKYLGLNPKLRDENQVPMPMAEIPTEAVPGEFDWRDHDAVTEVKDQGMCGSCWAFSVTGNIEGQWKKHSGKLMSLSEQELVDCDTLDHGCNGGLPDNAYRAIEQLGGLELESDYPYDGEQESCEYNSTLSRVQISGAVNISSNEDKMVQWLYANGPISIGINANAMQFYVAGISHPWRVLCNPNNLDHGVLIVGYGEKDYPLFNKKLPYWTIKNSWGKSWGEQGYYRVYRGDGTCGVNQMASSAVI